MSKWHDFFVKRAQFPFPSIRDDLSKVSATDISDLQAGLIASDWKAKHALRDDRLVEELCQTLEKILGEDSLEAGSAKYLLDFFSPKIQFGDNGFVEDLWSQNPNETHSRSLLGLVFVAAGRCLWEYGGYYLKKHAGNQASTGRSQVDYCMLVNNVPTVLCEAKSPSVMKMFGALLPPRGIQLTWNAGQPLPLKVLTEVALYLGLRKMEWLFLTCHNFWVVCRLVRDDKNPYLTYSPMISIEKSSRPFRALLGAILSTVKGVTVKSNPHSADLPLDVVEDPEPEPDSYDGSGGSEYLGSSSGGTATIPQVIRNGTRNPQGNIDSGLMITSSSPKSPEDFQVWVHLYAMANSPLVSPPSVSNSKRRLWLTRYIASGSTGSVWECRFDNSDNLFAAKIVEVLRRSDISGRQRLRNEFDVYLTLDEAQRSNKLRNRIAPRCYGGYEGERIDVMILELCDGVLTGWDELTASERHQVYNLVKDLHNVGIVHADIEPRNIARAHGGGFLLIDFSESRKHICKESKVDNAASNKISKCSELQALRRLLWKRQPLHVNLG